MDKRLQAIVDRLPDWIPAPVRDFLQHAISAVLQDRDPFFKVRDRER
jgi:hypothetical protein